MEKEHITCTIDALSSKSSIDKCYICSNDFKSKSNLRAHLIKTHKIIESVSDEAFLRKKKSLIRRIFHCPIDNCRYNASKDKGVSKFSVLKQHYQWVHMPHTFICPSCNKTFGTGPALKYHEKKCGQRFLCGICGTDFAEEKFLTYHTNRIHNKKVESTDKSTNYENHFKVGEYTQVLQPIYIPIVVPMNVMDISMLNSLQESSKESIALLQKLKLLKPETRDQNIQVESHYFYEEKNIQQICQPLLNSQGPMNMAHMSNNINHVQQCAPFVNWNDLNGGAYFEDTIPRNMFMGHCNASMQTMSDNFDNFYNVETQTNLAGFVGREFECSYGNILNEDLVSSFISEVGNGVNMMMQNNSDDYLKLSDNHTQTAKFTAIDYVDLSDIETQTNLQELDDLLFKN